MKRKKQKISHTSSEPIDLTVDTPPKHLSRSNATEDDDLIITDIVPPPAVVITSYKPAENTQQTVLGLMANIMEKVNSHNTRHSQSSSSYQTKRLIKSPKKPDNNPATVVATTTAANDTVNDCNPAPPTALRCAICLSSFSEGIQLSATVCGHIFCQDCIGAALKQGKRVCPICRKELKGKTAVHRLYI